MDKVDNDIIHKNHYLCLTNNYKISKTWHLSNVMNVVK